MELKPETLKSISTTLENTIGISYEDFEKLDFYEQQELIQAYRKKHKSKKSNTVTVMIGSGEHSCFVEAGVTPEEARQELDDKLDDIIYSKPVAFVKKIQRKIRNHYK